MVDISSAIVTLGDISSEVAKIKDKLIPSWLSFVVQFAALIVLLIVVFFVAYKPMKKMLKKRGDYIENNIRESEENKVIAERNAKQSEEIILASKKEAAEIIESAKLEAKKQAELSLSQAEEDIEKMKKQADLDILSAQEKALKESHDQMVDVALLASQEILKREVNSQDNERLAKDFIDQLH